MHLYLFSYLKVRGKIKVKIWLFRKTYVITSLLTSQSCPVSGSLQNPHSCPTVVNFWATQSYFENTSQGLGQGLDSLPRRLLGQYKVCKGGQMNREQKGLCGQTPTRGNESGVTDPDRPAEVKCHVFLGSLCTDTCTCVYMYTLEDNTKCPPSEHHVV